MRQPPMHMSSWDRLRYWRDMSFVKCNMRVLTDAGPGTLVHTDGDTVRLDGKKRSDRFHPWWQMVYYNQDGEIAKDYRV